MSPAFTIAIAATPSVAAGRRAAYRSGSRTAKGKRRGARGGVPARRFPLALGVGLFMHNMYLTVDRKSIRY